MKHCIAALGLLLLGFLYSCSHDNVDIQIVTETEISRGYSPFHIINSSFIASPTRVQTIHCQNIQTGKVYDIVVNNEAIVLSPHSPLVLWPLDCLSAVSSLDTIFSCTNNTINVRNYLREDITSYKIPNIYTPSFNQYSCLQRKGNLMLIGNASKTIRFAKQADRKLYYQQVKPLLWMKIDAGSIYCENFGMYPNSYQLSGNNYADLFPSACFGDEHHICVSFAADDSLYLYKDTSLIMTKLAKSHYINRFNAISDSLSQDMSFFKKYLTHEPKYMKVAYDPYQSRYYRIVQHRMKNEEDERFWSVIILDKHLNVLGEKKFSVNYNARVFVPTAFGILMKYADKKENKLMLVKFIVDNNIRI